MGDSSTGIAVSNNAVYVIGHFCKIDRGPGTTDTMSAKMGLNTCTGSSSLPNGVWRTHTAALALSDGTPLTWNAGADSTFGGQEVTVTTRGLFIGFDGQRADSIRTGSVAFFDLGPSLEDTTPPGTVTFTQPSAGGAVNNPAFFAGSATDNTAIASYRVRIRAADGRYVQADGTLNTTAYEFKPTALANGTFELLATMPAGAYTVQAKAVDVVGLVSAAWASRAFTETGIEGVPPQVTAMVNPTSPIQSENVVSVAGQATDNVAVALVEVRVTNAAGLFLQSDGTFTAVANPYPLVAGPVNNPAVDWSANLGSTLPPGAYTVNIRATDPTGNEGTKQVAFSVVTAAPAVVIASPAAKVLNTAPAVISGTVTDNVAVSSIVAQVVSGPNYLQDDGSLTPTPNELNLIVTGLESPAAGYSYNAGILPIGDYTVTATARDRVNNVTTATKAFTVTARVPGPAIVGYTGFSSQTDFFSNRTMGFTFRVTIDSQVLALGVQDTNRNGTLDNSVDTPVGIWRASDRTLIATVNVPRNAIPDAGWFYAQLPSPVTLTAGVTYVIGQRVYPLRERYASGGTAAPSADFVYLGSASTSGTSLAYPSSQSAATGGLGMPNMKFG